MLPPFAFASPNKVITMSSLPAAPVDATRFSHTIAVGGISPAASAMGRLVRIYPANALIEPIVLSQKAWLVGRDAEADIVLADDSVSRRHAMLDVDANGCAVSDLNSTNGTYVNEERVTKRLLAAGDRVRFGNQIFRYVTSDAIEAQYHELVYKMMTTDGLTQVHNKRYLLETLEREIARARRLLGSMCVAMLDLDKFKSVNDIYGHLAGDTVLVEFAKRAQAVLRDGELLARYGGEEFALVIPDASVEAGCETCERVRKAIASAPVRFEANVIPVTVSIGLKCLAAGEELTPVEMIAQADHHLYQAKHGGRNRVVG